MAVSYVPSLITVSIDYSTYNGSDYLNKEGSTISQHFNNKTITIQALINHNNYPFCPLAFPLLICNDKSYDKVCSLYRVYTLICNLVV